MSCNRQEVGHHPLRVGGRLERLQSLIGKFDLDALLVTKPENMRYVSGFTGEGLLLVMHGVACLLTDGRYQIQAGQEAPWLQVFISNELSLEAGRDLPGAESAADRIREGCCLLPAV